MELERDHASPHPIGHITLKRTIQVIAGALIALVLLYVLFRGVNWADLLRAMRSVSLLWLALCQIPLWLSFLTRIQRWKHIVRATAPASFRAMFSATQIGFLANFTLPARAGELIRPYVLGRLAGIPFSKGLALTALDRVTDLFGLIATMAFAGLAFHPKKDIALPKELLGFQYTVSARAIDTTAVFTLIVLAGLIAVLVLIYVNKRLALRLSDFIFGMISTRLAEWIHRLVNEFAEGLHILRSPIAMVRSIAWSFVTWGLFLVSTTCILQAFHLNWPWYAPLVVQSTLAILISVGFTPGFIGQFQAGVLAGLTMVIPGISYADALAVGVVAHIVNVLPIAITGVGCLVWENMGLLELQRASEEAEAELEEELDEEVRETT